MRVRVSCDGTDTKVYNAETGEDISKYVYAVAFRHTTGKSPTAEVTFLASALDYVGEARVGVQAVVKEDEHVNQVKMNAVSERISTGSGESADLRRADSGGGRSGGTSGSPVRSLRQDGLAPRRVRVLDTREFAQRRSVNGRRPNI